MKMRAGRFLFLVGTVAALTACNRTSDSAGQQPQTHVLRCENAAPVTFRQEGDTGWLFAEKTVKTTYEDGLFIGEGYRLKLDENVATLNDQTCQYDLAAAQWEHAKLNGADLRAVGNEPPWILELYPDKLVLWRGYDKKRIEQPIVKHGLSYLSKDYTVKLSLGPCQDSMSGEEFETRVQLLSEQESLQGCGRPLH